MNMNFTRIKSFILSPSRIIVLSFAFVILVGALLLNMSIASNTGQSIGFLDALFTATSATCVTGLVVADTLTQWSLFGQLVILALIQIGGLGLVTLASFFTILLKRKVGIKGMLLVQESINYFSYDGILRLVRQVVLVSFGIELLGATILSFSFIPQYGLKGIYLGIFHSISAYCNAGFDILGEYKSLTDYNNNPLVLYTIGLLIVIGGIGFIVLKDLFTYRKNGALLLHTKIVLILTFTLIFSGAIFFFGFEYNNPSTMGNLSITEKINSAFFHSITTRTAGFNSLPTNEMKEISKAATIFLMFVGAAPGSTAGGIKVTTLGVIIIAIISQIKGEEDIVVFKRRLRSTVVNKALAIIGLSGILVVISTTIMLAVENISFINILYETTSAFGTVGLSTGITPTLSKISRVVLIITMFLGRVGPASFAIALTLKSHNKKSVHPEGVIVVG